MTRALIITAILFTISAIAFNNCSGGFKAENSVINSSSSLCRTKVINAAKNQAIADPSLCENPVNYQCDLRRFRQGVGHMQNKETQCSNIAGIGQACVLVSIYNFDTTTQLQSAEASDSVEGGAYNRDEAICINTQITSKGIVVVQGEGASVIEALEKSIESCRQRGRL